MYTAITDLYPIYLAHPSVQTDTRKLQKGDLFFALKGPNFNGNAFAAAALEQGAAYLVVDEADAVVDERCLLVEDALTALQQLAAHHRSQFKIPFIAITGSNGKTTTKELVHAVLSASFKTIATQGNLNNHIGVPLTLLSIPAGTEMAIIEMGANHLREIASYCEIARPDYGIITNCGKAHLEGFGSIEGVRKGKGELYDYLRAHGGTAFRNTDLDYLKDMAAGISQQVTYGEAGADYMGKPLYADGMLHVAILNSGSETEIRTQLVGVYNFPNVMTAVAIGRHFGLTIDQIKAAIEAYEPGNSRSQLVNWQGNQVILDAYNANPSSMKVAIDNMKVADAAEKVLLLGAMKELGEESVQEHQQLVNQLADAGFEHVVLVGGDFAHTDHRGFQYFDSYTGAREWLQAQQFTNALILVKGSRAMTMEKIIA
jgi:UDP-N-acetylmuramoyl-tripeptide--D-alanyl-D-alanine ligase